MTSSLGPEAVDEILVACSQRLEAFALGGDTVARIGGEVFVLLLERLDGVADATRLADRLLDQLGREVDVVGRQVFVEATTASS